MMVIATSEQKTWKEVNKSNPCPICDRPDWCYLMENGEAVVCGRTHSSEAPQGWRYIKDALDGRSIFGIIKESGNHPQNHPRHQHRPKQGRVGNRESRVENNDLTTQKAIKLAPLPSIPQDQPIPISGQIPQWLILKGVPETATETKYRYSEYQWVSRYDWAENGETKKTIRQYHRKNVQVKCSKGNQPWKAYRIEEAIKYGQGKYILGVEGEKCVETARSLGLVAITWQGSSWSDEDIKKALQSLKDNGILGMIYLPDNDPEGQKKAVKIASIAKTLGFTIIILNPSQIWLEMPVKGDIADWVATKPEDPIKKIEETANAQAQREEFNPNLDISPEIPDSFLPTSEYTQSVLKTLYGDEYWLCVSDKLYRWTGTYYQLSPDVVERKRIGEFLNTYPKVNQDGRISYPHARPSSVENALKWVKIIYSIPSKLINPSGLNCTNGVLKINWLGNTPSWQLIEHHPSQYYLYEPIATYNPEADSNMCDRLLSALDSDQLTIFLRTIAASLDLATVRREKGRIVKALLLKGQGSNGKDSLREIVRMMYGYEGVTGCTLTDFRQYDEGRKFPLSRLGKSRVNWSSENATFAKIDNIQSLKAAITGDTLSKEGKGQDEEEFDPMAIFLFNCNDVPRMTGSMEAIASRYGVLSFNKTFKEKADPTKGEVEAEPRFKYNPQFLKSEVLPAFLNRVLAELTNLMAYGIDYSVTEATIKEIQAENSHLFQFCQDLGLGYVPHGSVSAGEIWQRLESWYIEQGTLTYEETGNNGKKKALWIDQSNKSDRNVKGVNQVIQRFSEIFPKAKRGKNHANQVMLRGIAFAEGSCLNSLNPDVVMDLGYNAQGNELSAEGNVLDTSIPDTPMDSGGNAIVNKGNEGNVTPPCSKEVEKTSPVETQLETPTTEVESKSQIGDSHFTDSTQIASTAFIALESSHRKDSDPNNCPRTALEQPSEAMAEEETVKIGDKILDVIIGVIGVVTGLTTERVIYQCREWGQVSRHRDLVTVLI